MAEQKQAEMCFECGTRPVRHADGRGVYCQICFDAIVEQGIKNYAAEEAALLNELEGRDGR